MTRREAALTIAAVPLCYAVLIGALLFFIARGVVRFCIRQWRGLVIVGLALIGARFIGFI